MVKVKSETLAMERWFKERGYIPFDFQKECWTSYLAGKSGILSASTGMGKTYALWPGPLLEYINTPQHFEQPAKVSARTKQPASLPLTVIWLTPLRALASDIAESLMAPVSALDLPFSVETRTGDTKSSIKQRQKERLPSCLITTPESLSILLSYPGNEDKFATLKLLVVDEWHELLSSKRGSQVELALARLRAIVSKTGGVERQGDKLRVWGLSATIGNLDSALKTLMAGTDEPGVLVTSSAPKVVTTDTVLPPALSHLPWTGHTGLTMVDEVVQLVAQSQSSIVFTNTRSQTEQWYQNMLEADESLCGVSALHHGSLDYDVRRWVEEALKLGRLRCVVSTASLDLGVDFAPVDRVLQLGSPKGVARAMQRAGRSGHKPGAVSALFMVPTHALELIELAAARKAIAAGQIESRFALQKPFDVLCQHVTTVALGSGFVSEELYREVKTTEAFKDLTWQEWLWVLNFVATGGKALTAYPDYHRIRLEDGRYIMDDKLLALKHRLSIGTIVSEQSMEVRFLRGGSLGHVEESFISMLKKGDSFLFAGRYLELVEVKEMKAYVRLSSRHSGPVPRWLGGRLPMSSELALYVRHLIDQAAQGTYSEPEMAFIKPLLKVQAQRSILPSMSEVLVEHHKSRDGYHLFVFTFEGRLVNEGLAHLIAFKLSRFEPSTFSIAINDWGFEILSGRPIQFPDGADAAAFFHGFDIKNLERDIFDCLNSTEMARRQFREIARVSGLIFQGYPGAPKAVKQVQVSATLLYDVFVEFDPGNLLVRQAHDEVLQRNLEISRMLGALKRLSQATIIEVETIKASPFALPLMVDRLRGKLSNEKLAKRVMQMEIELAKEMN